MRRFLINIGLLIALFLTACRPEGVLSQRKMQDVLYALHRADGILQEAGYNYSHDEQLAKYYQQVLEKEGITQAQFDSSLVWYTANPKRFEHIYPKVVLRLENEKDRVERLYTHKQQRTQISDEQCEAYLQAHIDRMIYGCSLEKEGYGWLRDRKNALKCEKNDEFVSWKAPLL